ncbi:MAG: tetratricopeptide repeat protein [Balneolaceae bacterium]
MELAESQANPSDRYPIYQNLYELSLESSNMEEPDVEHLDEIINRAWSSEQNSGVQLLQATRNAEDVNSYYDILAHFDNAIVLQPDSLVTYNLMATTFYENGSINNAIDTLERAFEWSNSSDNTIREKLAYLYLETGRTDEAINVYESLLASEPDNDHLTHGLTNAYMISNRHEDAIDRLTALVEQYPTRIYYREALASQLYYRFEEQTIGYLNDSGEISNSITISDLISQLDEIHSIFDELNTNSPSNEESIFRMATFYKNSAGQLLQLATNQSVPDEQAVNLNQLADFYLENAITHWERLADMNPGNLEYLSILYDLYIQTERIEEAESIERSYNF